DVVAVNDVLAAENSAYLIKYDSVYGQFGENVYAKDGMIHVDKHSFKYLSEKDPAALPWKDLNVDIVIESTGRFTERVDAMKHIQAGAKFVIISAPTKSADVPTVVYGVNDADGNSQVISCASCTTNSLTPVVEIIGRRLGIQKAIMTTVHGYTAGQGLVDGPGAKNELRRGRAAAINIVPASTGAAKATTLALPQYKGKFDGTSLRVPVPVGSVSDVVFLTEKNTTKEEVNAIFTEEAGTARYKELVRVTNDPIVSSDIIGDPHACIIDLEMTKVVDGNLLKVFAWYDNEWGYTNQMMRQARKMAASIK
ncbi:MAG TPA: glyceraldehyde 3-phosphate dehydrogenase NAD-binding domain-containing protein, partial [Terriglobales bacterium]|nr:glyceraldehyde 3-phosphate dehydrogenase NAD-binding domain-containing protein [Terriglobales bacterium]